MTLYCQKYHYDDVKLSSWVTSALRLNVRQLTLIFQRVYPWKMLVTLDGCTTLVDLHLSLNSELFISNNYSLPCLKGLHISDMIFDDRQGASINEMIIGCPLLEDLTLINCEMNLMENLVIQSPMLKNLKIIRCWFIRCSSGLVLHSPNLECLWYQDSRAYDYHIGDSKSLLAVHIDDTVPSIEHFASEHDIFEDDEDDLFINDYTEDDHIHDHNEDVDNSRYYKGVAKLVAACSSSCSLSLSSSSIYSLGLSSQELPLFQNLTQLMLGSLDLYGWRLLAHLLWSSPNLQIITFKEGCNKNYRQYADFECLVPCPPICVKLHIKKIEFLVFDGQEDEMKLLEYFLENAEVLEEAVLQCMSSMISSIVNRLPGSPSRSKIVLAQR